MGVGVGVVVANILVCLGLPRLRVIQVRGCREGVGLNGDGASAVADGSGNSILRSWSLRWHVLMARLALVLHHSSGRSGLHHRCRNGLLRICLDKCCHSLNRLGSGKAHPSTIIPPQLVSRFLSSESGQRRR